MSEGEGPYLDIVEVFFNIGGIGYRTAEMMTILYR